MKQLMMNDGRSTEVQSVSVSNGIMHVRMILTTSEQIRALFGDKFATSVMTLYENGKPVDDPYENYTIMKYIKEEAGGIWEVEMRQTRADTDTRLTALEEKATQQESDIKDLGDKTDTQKKELANLKTEVEESGKVVDPAVYSASVVVARANAQALTDAQALEAKVLYATFDELVSQGYTAEKAGFKFRNGDDLWKTAQDNVTFQAQYRPGEGTESLYTHIDEAHAGTMEDPIPAKANMEYEYGKYYSEDGTIYLCQRGGVPNPEEMYGQKVTLQYLPSALIGQYFVVAEE